MPRKIKKQEPVSWSQVGDLLEQSDAALERTAKRQDSKPETEKAPEVLPAVPKGT